MSTIHLPVKHVQQPRIGECLPACAAMVLDYIGVSVRYRRLLRILEVIPNTGTASFKIRNLSQIGVNVLYEQGTLNRLHHQLLNNHPCIVFVRTVELPYRNDDTDHALVVAGMDEQSIYLHDPESPTAPTKVSLGDFDLAWLERDELYAVLTV
ncbi:MAG: peptidase C39 family protein [Caldilineaceae bacterium]|nr:peptidase C39 family protein [Caldilineaceae bacterium]